MKLLELPLLWPVTCNTFHCGPGSTFVAIKGAHFDGLDFIPQAIASGATTIVIDKSARLTDETLNLIKANQAHLIHVENTRKALAELSAQAHGYPAKKLKIIGITGTKGKTSTAFLTEHILKATGYKTALISTVCNRIGNQRFPALLTTEQPDYLQQFLALCCQQNVDYVIMEVAAQALSLHRVEGILFDCAVFTNFSQEHSEFYPSQDDYFAAKAQILKHMKPGAPLFCNGDDIRIATFAHDNHLATFHLSGNLTTNTICGTIKATNPPDAPLTMSMRYHHDSATISCSTLYGRHNAYNVIAACTLTASQGLSLAHIAEALSSFTQIPGRFECITMPNSSRFYIDYAHNPSSFESILSTLKSFNKPITIVFGAGGNRDHLKRPLMGSIAAQYGDLVIITTDNPRDEDPDSIVNAILKGISAHDMNKIIIEPDRAQAIKKAYTLSLPGSLIALLGKGPDEYQEIKKIKYPFSERSIIQELANVTMQQNSLSRAQENNMDFQ